MCKLYGVTRAGDYAWRNRGQSRRDKEDGVFFTITDLELDRSVVIYPGTRRYFLTEETEVLPLVELAGRSGRWARF